MNENFFNSKKAFMDRFQKRVNKNCFKKCYQIQESNLDKDCFLICYDKYNKSSRIIFNYMKNLSQKKHSIYHFKLFYQKNPFLVPVFGDSIRKYAQPMEYIFAKDYLKDHKI
jgi:hypothetical protein